ncbi:hypothetical protein [Bacillus tuaregi]|uniref:hypothetical protein n=1 Tax=Bacillus tuaregi TaxID=1816695 RepID=UPI000A071E8C|nr:hypothetical protein [Bacillus tuaregi]
MLMKVKTKWRGDAISHFMEELIDYAGLFPPAALSLSQAIQNYQSYISSSDSWMMGPFVIPVSRLKELDEYRSLFNEPYPLRLSVILSRKEELENELVLIEHFLHKYQNSGSVEAIEVSLSPDSSPSFLKKLATRLDGYPIYCEVAGGKDEILPLLDGIRFVNKESTKPIGVKLRMGGIRAALFPSAQTAAFVIHESQKRGLFIKFTAGLHHPIRQFRQEVETKMHGFVNVFTASLLAYRHALDVETIEAILLDEDSSHFSFTPKGLSWQHLTIHSKEIIQARSFFAHSYGSCSFDEPREELGELSIYHEEEVE